ncbi:uncharacterized protein FA14DRAFT_80669 [Meira miltonrushii]|uniref:Uncharacterized protein n=1 Tax=Meira miltonrushii TaxID=1280837 RepID=A0A316V608_9BASI|nr:uncharacterized protein FA14DRAFT_80669 [Meira miltonrushii]PWN33017.1 hypothetical protein FA14DRAFT_80669 [Meira miltonrushii]
MNDTRKDVRYKVSHSLYTSRQPAIIRQQKMHKIFFNVAAILPLLVVLVQASSKVKNEKYPTQAELRKQKPMTKKLPESECNKISCNPNAIPTGCPVSTKGISLDANPRLTVEPVHLRTSFTLGRLDVDFVQISSTRRNLSVW